MNQPEALQLSEYAIVVHPAADNVALAKKAIGAGSLLQYGDRQIRICRDLAPGERVALSAIPAGEYLFQYGYPFARSGGIGAGEPIGAGNTSCDIPPLGELRPSPAQAPPLDPSLMERTFMGYRRADGRCGTRNYYIVVPTSMCASAVAQQIVEGFPTELPGIDAVLALPHTEGCGCAAGAQIERLLTVLKNSILHQNVAGALIVDLGCEQTNYPVVRAFLEQDAVAGTLKPVDWLTIQHEGGAARTVARGIEMVAQRTAGLSESRRVPCPLGALTIGSECGASDAFSGVSANRVIGAAVDRVIGAGGAAIFSEFPEMVGAEQILFPRMRSVRGVEKFQAQMEWYRQLALSLGTSMEHNLVPENKAGGLINPYIKSLGAVMKGGGAAIEDVLEYGERHAGPGLYLMQGPGNDLESVTGLAASGANLILFSTGRGTVTGCALVPVLKISSTSELYARMPDDMDFDAGPLLREAAPESLAPLGEALLELIVATASGQKSKPEINRQRQFQIWSAGKLSL